MPRALGAVVALVAVVAFAGPPGRADGRHPAYVVYPGWRITTSEEAWANKSLADGLKKYPISSLVDGDLTTAWVFEGPKCDADRHWYAPVIGQGFSGGLGQWIEIRGSSDHPPLIDAVGIVNGYAKDAPTYHSNNRITRIRLEAGREVLRGDRWESSWSKTVELAPVMWMQIVPIPEMPAERVRLVVEEVETGRDDDLCISDIQLYHEGRAVIPRPTRYLLASPGASCGCMWALGLVDRAGRPVFREGPLSPDSGFDAYRFVRGDRIVVLTSSDSVVAADLNSGKRVYQWTGQEVRDVAWLPGDKLCFNGRAKTHTPVAYEVDFSGPDVNVRSLGH